MDRLTAQGQAFEVMSRAMYTDRCTIQRPTTTKGPTGGNVPGAAEVLATDVPCRRWSSSANEREFAGAPHGSNAYTVRMPEWHNSQMLEVDSRCELVIAAREGGAAAQTLKVIAPLPSGSGKVDIVAVKQT